jgi:hypothetical protein
MTTTPAMPKHCKKAFGVPDGIFKRSAHAAHIEETERYNQVLADFWKKRNLPGLPLKKQDRSTKAPARRIEP